MLKRFAKKNAKLTAAVTLGLCLATAPSAFALNTAGSYQGAGNGNKPISLTGYRYLDNGTNADTLELNFNKETSSPGETTNATDFAKLITIKNASGTSKSFTITTLTQTGDMDGTSHYSKGTKAILTFTNELNDSTDANTLYSVEIDNKLMDKNGITLGNYMNRQNLKFYFQVPDNDGAYTGNPYVTYVVGDPTDVSSGVYQNVSWESDLTVVFDRPFYNDATALSTFKTGVSNAYRKWDGSDWDAVVSQDGNGSSPYECYSPKSNDTNNVNTVFFFPETNNGYTSGCYNRTNSDNSYRLTLPSDFYDVNNRHTTAYTGSGSTFYFDTVSADYPGWEQNGATTNSALTTSSPAAGQLDATWYPTPIAPTPDSYKVYITNGDKFTGTYTEVTSNISFSTDGSGNKTCHITGLSSGSYYLRVVPYEEDIPGSVGFSIANASAQTVS